MSPIVQFDEVLCHLMARTNTPSTMGVQLDAAENASALKGKPRKSPRSRKATLARKVGYCEACDSEIAINEVVSGSVHLRCFGEKFVHEGMFVNETRSSRAGGYELDTSGLPIVLCLDALAATRNCNVVKERPALAKLSRGCTSEGRRTQGELVIQCLRAFCEFRVGPAGVGPGHSKGGLAAQVRALDAVYAWAGAKAPKQFPAVEKHTAETRGKAAELYGDCYLILAEHVAAWNREVRRAAKLKAS